MRPFLTTVGVLAWIWALGVLWVFAESGGALTVIAAGIFAILAVLSLAAERILKTLEEIRDHRPLVARTETIEVSRPVVTQAPVL